MTTRPILIGGDTGAVLSSFTPEPVSLATLKASRIAIEWHEGIAIIQEVSRCLLEASPSQSGSELSGDNVKIDQTGTVLVPRGGVQDGPSAVSQIGAVLHDVLPDNLPVPLRLAVSQALSNPPHYTSIKSFSEALSYFERPDRTGIIRAVYARWEANASDRHATKPHGEQVEKTQPAAEEPPRKERRTRTAPGATPWIVVAVCIGLAITLGLILAVVWGVRFGDPAVDGSAESASSPDRSAGAAPFAPAASEIASVGTTRTSALPPPATVAPRLEAAFTTAPIGNARPESEPVLSTDAPVPMETPRQSPRTAPAATETPVSITLVEPTPTAHIYSALDTEVAAPVAAYPQSPVVATVFDDDETLTFDVVIDQTGKVESVKLLRAPSSIRSTLMLTMSMSVAKAWRFQPATRHGQSVRYRQSISVPVGQ